MKGHSGGPDPTGVIAPPQLDGEAPSSVIDRFLAGGGEMGQRVGSFNWSATDLGALETWPKSLISYVAMVLELPTPAIIFWGPNQTQIYNEGYSVIMGPRHPRYLGAPYRECWPDTYPVISPWMRKVLERGEVVRVEKTQILVTRHGFSEEAYFSFTFSPLRDDDGNIAGILQPVFEVTDIVLSERRSTSLAAASANADSCRPVKDVIDALAENAKDIPFSIVYLWDESKQGLVLAEHSDSLAGYEPGFMSAPLLDIARRAMLAGTPTRIDDLQPLLAGRHVGPWPEPTRSACVVPLGSGGSAMSRGVVVFGISPRLHFDASYRAFLELAAGRVAAALAILEAAQKRSELQASEARIHNLFMSAPAYIVMLEGPEHVIELANPLYLQLVGRTNLRGKTLRDALPEIVEQGFLEILDEVYASGKPFIGKELPALLDRNGDGVLEERFFDFVYQPSFGAGGEITGIVAFGYDMTDQVRSRQQVQQAQARLNFALNAAGVGYWDLDLTTHTATRSLSHDRLFGYHDLQPNWTFETFLGHVVESDREAVASSFERARQTGEDWQFECRIVRADGALRWISAHGRSDRSTSGAPLHMLGIVVDITERKTVEGEREARLEAMARTVRFSELFVGMLGHDLRTPLSAITMAADMLISKSGESEKIAKPAARILHSAERMRRMIDQLLDFTRARLGAGIALQRSRVDIADICRLVVDELEGDGSVIELDARGDTAGEWDGDRLAQLLSNLLANALTHGTPGSPVRAQLDGSSPAVLRLHVHNSGVIPPELVPVIFEPFRGGGQKLSGSSGLGLGLFITQQIALAHGGSICVQSSEPAGTQFTVALPRRSDDSR